MTLTNLRGEYWGVEVPSMAFGCDINNYGDESVLMYMLSMEDIADDQNSEETLITKQLPKGSWQIICTTKECTEEQLVDVVRELPVKQRYENYCGDYPIWYHTRKESLQSLLKSKGLNGPNYIILKKQ